jgi:glycerol-3-phosphate acyltransferase PlsY
MIINAVLMILVAYLLGSVSTAVLVCRLWHLPDPRQQGSNNPGATNVYRIGGRVPALLTLICDVFKGTIPVWSGYFLKIEPLFLGMIAVAACLGHIYPIYFQFRGGKGVATAFGALLPIGTDLVGLMIASWLLVVLFTGYASLAAIIAALLAPLFTWLVKPIYTLPVSMLSLLIIFRHRENIVRLIKGNESKIK